MFCCVQRGTGWSCTRFSCRNVRKKLHREVQLFLPDDKEKKQQQSLGGVAENNTRRPSWGLGLQFTESLPGKNPLRRNGPRRSLGRSDCRKVPHRLVAGGQKENPSKILERFSNWPLDIPRGTERNAPGIQPRNGIIAQMFENVKRDYSRLTSEAISSSNSASGTSNSNSAGSLRTSGKPLGVPIYSA